VKNHRVVLVVESPFSERDRDRFGVTDLVEAGLEVEVWDVTDLTLPNARRQWYIEPSDVSIHRLTDWSAFASLTSGLTSDDAIILLCGVSGPIGHRYLPLLEPSLESPAVVGTIASGSIPPPFYRARVRHAIKSAAARVAAVTKQPIHLPRGLDFIWAGTTDASIDRALRTSATVTRYIHSLDYDLILGRPPTFERSDAVLFIDGMGPNHPDYVSLEMENPWRPGAYESLVKELLEACDRAGQHVVVAAHPRAARGSLYSFYPGRTIVHGETAKLISACRYILTIEGSTSLGMAAAMGTPVVIVADDRVPPYVQALAMGYHRSLDAPMLQVGSLFQTPINLSFDERAYTDYVRRYVKRPGSPMVRFWAMVADDLKSAWESSVA
jgi:hypothetical protein